MNRNLYHGPLITSMLHAMVVLLLLISGAQQAGAQCCSNGVNLLAAYNTDFSAPFTTRPPGFVNDNMYSNTPGAGYYTIITARNYGACTATPEFDHTAGNNTGRYLWFDTPGWATAISPAVAWMPFLPAPAGNDSFITVTPNTDYVFSTWIRDLARATDCVSGGAPIMGLRINGVNQAQVDLGATTAPCCPQWTYMCAVWNSGSATTALIKIESRTGSGFTDLGIDDVYFGTTLGNYQGVLGPDTTICAGQSLTLQSPSGTSVIWSDGSTASTYVVNAPGLYWGSFSQNGCTGRDTIVVSQAAGPTVSLRSDTTLCNAANYTLASTTTGNGLSYTWQDSSHATSLTASATGLYWLRVENGCGSATDTVNLMFATSPLAFTLGSDTDLCNGTSVTLAPVPFPSGTLLWSDGSAGNTLQASTAGQYKLMATNQCGSSSDSMLVSVTLAPIAFTLGNDTALCNGASVTLAPVPFPSGTLLWSDGSAGNTLQASNPGQYKLTATNRCGSSSDSMLVSAGLPPAAFSLGPDTSFCAGAYDVLVAVPLPSGSFLWQDGAFGNTYTATTAGSYSLTVTNSCGSTSDEVVISLLNVPTVLFGPDTALCAQQFTIVPVVTDGQQYNWSNGSTDTSLTITSGGSYSLVVTNLCGTAGGQINIVLGTLPDAPFAMAAIDTCDRTAITLDALNAGSLYLWSTGDSSQQIVAADSGSYAVTITNADNCNISDTISLNYYSCIRCTVLVPTAFSPNEDGKNDEFRAIANCSLKRFKMKIYNRWGEKVYETDDAKTGWDGFYKNSKQPIGTFVYNLEYSFRDGDGKTRFLNGNVTLLR